MLVPEHAMLGTQPQIAQRHEIGEGAGGDAHRINLVRPQMPVGPNAAMADPDDRQ